MTMFKRMASVLALAAVVLTVVPQLTVAAPQREAKPEMTASAADFQERLTNLQTTIDAVYASLDEEDQTKAYNKRYKTVRNALAELEDALVEGKTAVKVSWGMNLQEKRAMLAILSDLTVKVRLYQKDVEAINDQFEEDGDEDVANAALTAQVAEQVEWLQTNKDLFIEYFSNTLELKIKAALYYTDIGITFATEAAAGYTELGYDATKASELLATARTQYDTAEAQYKDGKKTEEGETDDQQQLYYAMVNILKARANVSNAEYKIINIEKAYLADEEDEGSQQ